jgi:hypothetical protein
MTYQLKLQTQLGHGTPVPGRTTGSRDCGPRSVAMAIDWATEGQRKLTIPQVREALGKPGPALVNVDDARRALTSLGLPYWRTSSVVQLRRAMVSGKLVHLCVDYGVLNRELHGQTGDPAFTGGHSVVIVGQRKQQGTVQWQLYDPLDDGRRAGIPTGPRWVARRVLLAAALALGNGVLFAGIISRAGKPASKPVKRRTKA